MNFSNLLIIAGLTLVLSALVRIILKPNTKNVKLYITLGNNSHIAVNKAAIGFVSLLLIGLVLQVVGVLLP